MGNYDEYSHEPWASHQNIVLCKPIILAAQFATLQLISSSFLVSNQENGENIIIIKHTEFRNNNNFERMSFIRTLKRSEMDEKRER